MENKIERFEKMTVAFINTDEEPVSVKRLGLFKMFQSLDGTKIFMEMCQFKYLHPETDMLTVDLYDFVPVTVREVHIPLFEQSINAMNALTSISGLVGYGSLTKE